MFVLRCLVDLQLLTIFQFLRPKLRSWQGRVLDVGAGEAPWRDLMPSAEYVGVDVDSAGDFGMSQHSYVTYYDGRALPFADGNFDHVLCVEVLEHVPDPVSFLLDLKRVLRSGGSLVLTVPWSARLHHLPHDYTRFTRYWLSDMLRSIGFTNVTIEERGNDIAAIANKLLVLNIRLLRPVQGRDLLWSWVPAALIAPVTLTFLFSAHVALLLGAGSKDDPLGYGVVAVKT